MRSLLAAWLILFAALPALAQPRAAPCTAPEGLLRDLICADGPLRSADAQLRAAERALSAVTTRPATQAHRATAWQRRLEAGDGTDRGGAARPFTRDELLDEYKDRVAAVEDRLRQARSIRALEQPRCAEGQRNCPSNPVFARPMGLERSCIGNALRNCRVTAAGMVVSEERGSRVLFQIQYGFTETDGLRAGIVLMSETRGGWRLLGWSFEGVTFEAPRLVEGDGEGLLLHVQGRSGGSGSANADLLYRLRPEGWIEIETESWWDILPSRLPPGLDVWQGVTYDFEQMAAPTPLWREADANCCPTGGRARLGFRMEGRSLALTEVSLDALARSLMPRPDACPAERATYRLAADADWTAELRREGPPPSAASDLLLKLISAASGQDYWFTFAAAQGYGGLSILPIAPPGPDLAAEGVTLLDMDAPVGDALGFHAVMEDLSIPADPPSGGQPAPRHLFFPGLGRALYYGGLPQQATSGVSRDVMPPGFWTLSDCR